MPINCDTLIIGGGPAGLTAGIYSVRSGLDTILIEKGILGGQVVTTAEVENYPGFPDMIQGPELIERIQNQALRFGLKIKTMCEASKIEIKDHMFHTYINDGGNDTIISRTLILATGNMPKRLGAPNEERLTGRGVSYCATCDGALYRNREIAVIGGGDSALTEALFLTNFASKISLIHRRDKFRGEKILAERVLAHPKINVIWNTVVTDIKGDEFTEGVSIKNVLTGQESLLNVDGVFIFAGLSPNTQLIKNSPHLAGILTEDNYIITEKNCKTKIEGLYAAGDVRTDNFRQIVVACSDGATAAWDAYHYIDHSTTK
ncbi:MAG: thioredoxin-disulfide reductase [Candidatus Wallbacteria bacterium]